jgi:RNA polymerase sigma-70 factor (ECF subfamily)
VSAELRTAELNQLLERFQRGDARALDALLRRTADRLERMARAMLNRYPRVRQHEQTADVIQEASLSLVRALEGLSFASTRDFYNLAAEHVRRRLIDLTRYHQVPGRGLAALEQVVEVPERLPAQDLDADLESWAALHAAVEGLPAEEREVFCLRFYHDWEVQEIAELLQVSVRTVNRTWQRALLGLRRSLGDRPLPADMAE